MKIYSYRTQLKELQNEKTRLLGLERAEELQRKVLDRDRRLELLRDLEDTRLPWPNLLREIEGINARGIVLRKIHFEADGRIILQGRAMGLADLALFLSVLETRPSLDLVVLNYVKIDGAGGWVFDILGWVKKRRWGSC